MKYYQIGEEYGQGMIYRFLNKDNAVNKAKELLFINMEQYAIGHFQNSIRCGDETQVTEVKYSNVRIVLEKDAVKIVGVPQIRKLKKIEHIEREIKEEGKPYKPEIKTIEDKIIYDWQGAYSYKEPISGITKEYLFLSDKGYCERYNLMEDTDIVIINIYKEEKIFEDEDK